MQNRSKFTLLTNLQPDEDKLKNSNQTVDQKSASAPPSEHIRIKRRRTVRRLSASERLFRNTAVACALLLCVMALKNIDSPATNKITDAVKSVISMDMNLPSSVGNLSFVQKIMPESALVFLNLTDSKHLSLPVSGEIIHAFSEAQPWTEYRCEDNAPVYALEGGKVEACVQTQEGDYSILVSAPDQKEYLYAFLHSPSVRTGDSIQKGAQIGLSGVSEHARLYLEYRHNGTPSDPKTLLGE